MNLNDFIEDVKEKEIDFSLGNFIIFYKRKRIIINNVEWSTFDYKTPLKIFLCINPIIEPKNILFILQYLYLLKDSIKKFEEVKCKSIKNDVYLKLNSSKILIKRLKIRKGNIVIG